MTLPSPPFFHRSSLVTHHKLTHALTHTALYTTYNRRAHACSTISKSLPPPLYPFRNLCKFGFRFPSDHTDRRANIILMNIVVGARVCVPCCCVHHHKELCIHFGTCAVHINQLLVSVHFKISKNNINSITSGFIIF